MSKQKTKDKEIEDIWIEDSEQKIRDMGDGKDMAVPEKEGFTDFDDFDDFDQKDDS